MRDLFFRPWASSYSPGDQSPVPVISQSNKEDPKKKRIHQHLKNWITPVALTVFSGAGIAAAYFGRNYFSKISIFHMTNSTSFHMTNSTSFHMTNSTSPTFIQKNDFNQNLQENVNPTAIPSSSKNENNHFVKDYHPHLLKEKNIFSIPLSQQLLEENIFSNPEQQQPQELVFLIPGPPQRKDYPIFADLMWYPKEEDLNFLNSEPQQEEEDSVVPNPKLQEPQKNPFVLNPTFQHLKGDPILINPSPLQEKESPLVPNSIAPQRPEKTFTPKPSPSTPPSPPINLKKTTESLQSGGIDEPQSTLSPLFVSVALLALVAIKYLCCSRRNKDSSGCISHPCKRKQDLDEIEELKNKEDASEIDSNSDTDSHTDSHDKTETEGDEQIRLNGDSNNSDVSEEELAKNSLGGMNIDLKIKLISLMPETYRGACREMFENYFLDILEVSNGDINLISNKFVNFLYDDNLFNDETYCYIVLHNLYNSIFFYNRRVSNEEIEGIAVRIESSRKLLNSRTKDKYSAELIFILDWSKNILNDCRNRLELNSSESISQNTQLQLTET